MKKRICIVTPDFVGPIRNGGIGTHCYNLARLLAKDADCEVTVLFTGPFEREDESYWKRKYEKMNIEFATIDKSYIVEFRRYGVLVKSMAVYEYLCKIEFDFIHFQDWRANGFVCVQAKKTGQAFLNTILTVTMHSSTEWISQGMEEWYANPFVDGKVSWCERFCCTHADILISPSRHMFEWAVSRGWKLSDNRQTIPYYYEREERLSELATEVNVKHLVFFGRLETRKGLKVFCDALDYVQEQSKDLFERISFIGRPGVVGSEAGVDFVKKFAKKHPEIEFDTHTSFDTFQALTFIKDTGSVAVLPSLLDNYPFTVLECIKNKIPFVVSNVGGIPEMVNDKVLFNPNPYSLGKTLQDLRSILGEPVLHKYSKEQVEKQWMELHAKRAEVIVTGDVGKPKVSVCVPYYNLGRYLSQLLKSLDRQDYTNFEVVVVNDGSTENWDVEEFSNMKKRYEQRGWKFVSKEHGGVAETREVAVEEAGGEYLLFMDADNIATKNMISDFVRGIHYSKADCLTCHMNIFAGDQAVSENTKSHMSYLPLGGCLEIGCLENVFGDTNFIISKKVFLALGGFKKDVRWIDEDWEFLARLNLEGYQQHVVPKTLFWYRYLETSRRRRSVHRDFEKYQVLLNTYRTYGPEYLGFMLNLLLPFYVGTTKSAQAQEGLVAKLAEYPFLFRLASSGVTYVTRVYGLARQVLRKG